MSEIQPKSFVMPGKSTRIFTLDGLDTIARVVSVYDGDTLNVVMPFAGTFYQFVVRLDGIDACELKATNEENKQLAKQARTRLITLISPESTCFETSECLVRVQCGKFDKYGRLLAKVYGITGNLSACYNDVLVTERLAYVYKGKKKLDEAGQIAALTPTTSDTPATSDTSDTPAKPVAPTTSDTSDTPAKPVAPTKPAKPSRPAKPVAPV
jgi:endonuclease YncB( thermonuclease family)